MVQIIPYRSFDELKTRAGEMPATDGVIFSPLSPEELAGHCRRVKHGIFDFDKTITPGNQHEGVRRLLPESVNADDAEIFRWMLGDDKSFMHFPADAVWHLDMKNPHPVERAAIEAAFIGHGIGIMQSLRLKKFVLEHVGEELPIREGVRELFALTEERCIVSWGFETIIEAWLRKHGLTAEVAAIKLIFDDQRRLCCYHPGSVMTGETKCYAARRFRQRNGILLDGVLTVGDSIFDLAMMEESRNNLNILLIQPDQLASTFATFESEYYKNQFTKVTGVLVSNSLRPLVELIDTSRKLHG